MSRSYAFSLHLVPIVILDGVLMPVNIIRLIGALREHTADLRGRDPRPGAANSGRYWPHRSGIA